MYTHAKKVLLKTHKTEKADEEKTDLTPYRLLKKTRNQQPSARWPTGKMTATAQWVPSL